MFIVALIFFKLIKNCSNNFSHTNDNLFNKNKNIAICNINNNLFNVEGSFGLVTNY